jgi:hypothetical protein
MPEKMGIGPLGFNNTIFKRKFRFTFEITNICGRNVSVPTSFVKLAARPSLVIEDTEFNFLHAKTWVPGRATWEAISVTYIDAINPQKPNFFKPLFDWLASLYAFHRPAELYMGSTRENYSAVGILKMLDGNGTILETWTLNDMWPTAINFGSLDYSSNEETTIELNLRYSDVVYTPNCPAFTIESCCSENTCESYPNFPI